MAVPKLRLPFFVCLFKLFLGSPKGAYRDTSRKVKLCESPGKAGGFPFINKTEILKRNERRIYTVPEVIGTLDEIVADKNILTNKYERRYAITKVQKDILSCFGLDHTDIDRAIKEL